MSKTFFTAAEYKDALKDKEKRPITRKRLLRVLDTQTMPNGDVRKRSFGFHWPQTKDKNEQ